MKEAVVIPNQGAAGVANYAQTVYAGSMTGEAGENIVGQRAGSGAAAQQAKKKEEEKPATAENTEKKETQSREGDREAHKNGQEKEAKLVDPIKNQSIEIKNIDDLKALAVGLELELEKNPQINPFRSLSTEDLKKAYLEAQVVSSRLEAGAGSLGQIEKVPEYMRVYNQLLMGELKNRGVNLTELFYQAAEKTPIRSIGAAELTADNFADVPALAAIVAEINDEADRLEGRPRPEDRNLKTRYLQDQRTRVRQVIDGGMLNPAQISRGRELINAINERIDREAQIEEAQSDEQYTEQGRTRKETIINERGEEEDIIRHLGLSHERYLHSIEKRKMRMAIDEIVTRSRDVVPEEIVEHEALDGVFNRIFEYSDNALRSQFDQGMGRVGEEERNVFLQELSLMYKEYAEQSEDQRNTPENTPERRRLARVKKDIVNKFQDKYQVEYETRSLLHNAFYIAETEREFEDFAKFVKNFESGYADQAFLHAPEVETAYRIREQVLYEIRRENNGYLPPELVTYNTERGETEWERRTKEYMYELNDKANFGGTPGHGISDWKIKRALTLSRGLGMVMLRFPEISAESAQRSPSDNYQVQASIPWEKLAWDLNPLDHKIKRYNMGREVKAIFYAARKRSKKGIRNLWNQDELKAALHQDAIGILGTMGDSDRIVDMRNLFRTGGPFSHTGWRPYIAGLKEDRSELKESLKRNSGLAMNMIFNRYEISGLGAERHKFFLDNKDKDISKEELAKEWEEKVRELKAGGKFGVTGNKAWEKAEKDSWIKSTDRIPHVMLRVILDEANGLMKKGELNDFIRKVENAVGNKKITSKEFTEIERALELAKEHLMKRRRDRGDSFTDDEDKLNDEDFEQIDNLDQRANAMALHAAIANEMRTNKNLLDNIFKRVDGRMFPYAVTAQDVPWSEFNFGQTGARGFFTRKVNDAEEVAKADEEMEMLVKHLHEFKSPEEVAEQLKKIFYHAEIYDYERAQDAIKDLAIGIIRYYEKDGILKIPILGEIMGPINAIRGRGESFAQTVGGGHAMSWDSDDIYNFTEQLRQIFKGSKDDTGRDIIAAIRKETGGTLLQALGKKTKIALYLLMLFLSYEMIDKLISEKQ